MKKLSFDKVLVAEMGPGCHQMAGATSAVDQRAGDLT
jgi:hypothetical protein